MLAYPSPQLAHRPHHKTAELHAFPCCATCLYARQVDLLPQHIQQSLHGMGMHGCPLAVYGERDLGFLWLVCSRAHQSRFAVVVDMTFASLFSESASKISSGVAGIEFKATQSAY